jgi:Ca2+-binding RTX toxin-like protein
MTSYTYGGSTSGMQTGLSYTTMMGGNGIDLLIGSTSNNHIIGNMGNDILVGNGGFDLLEGNAGNDTFVFQHGLGYDTVKSFDPLYDRIRLTAGTASQGYSQGYTLDLNGTGTNGVSAVQQNGGTALIYQGEVWMFLQGFTGTLTTSHFIVQ